MNDTIKQILDNLRFEYHISSDLEGYVFILNLKTKVTVKYDYRRESTIITVFDEAGKEIWRFDEPIENLERALRFVDIWVKHIVLLHKTFNVFPELTIHYVPGTCIMDVLGNGKVEVLIDMMGEIRVLRNGTIFFEKEFEDKIDVKEIKDVVFGIPEVQICVLKKQFLPSDLQNLIDIL